MFTTPRRAALPIFTNNDAKPHTGTTLAIFATLTQFQHAIAQFVAYDPSSRRRRRNRDRGCSRRRAILRRHHDPCSVATLLVTSLLVVTVAAWTRPRNGSAGRPATDRRIAGPAPAVQCSA